MPNIETIEGIGPVLADKLKAAGVSTVEALLEQGATPGGRRDLEAATGIDGSRLLRFVNQADLRRIRGIGEEYGDLLECAGVDTVVELARRNAENLHAKMGEINAEKHLVRQLPSLDKVKEWIDQAKSLPRMVHY